MSYKDKAGRCKVCGNILQKEGCLVCRQKELTHKDKVREILKGVFCDGQVSGEKSTANTNYRNIDHALSEIEKIYDERFELCVPSDLTTVMRDIIRFRWKETRQGD